MATTTEPQSPDRAVSAWWRPLAGTLVGGILALAALGQGLFAGGAAIGAAWAATGPGTKSRAAQSLLIYSQAELAPGLRASLARDALRRAPLHPQAASYLAMLAQGDGDRLRERRILSAAAQLGWQDEAAHRQLYNDRISAGDLAGAMVHAEALLRQNLSSEVLAADFAKRLDDKAFRDVWTERLATGEPWAEKFLRRYGSRMPDAALQDLLKTETGVASVHPALVDELIRAGRFALAGEVLSAVRGGPLVLPRWEQRNKGSSNDWAITEDFAVTDEGELRRLPVPRADPISTKVAFPPGRYRLLPVGERLAPLDSWRWKIECIGGATVEFTLLSSGMGHQVPAACPVQTLSISAEAAAYTGAPLARLEVVPIGQAAGELQ